MSGRALRPIAALLALGAVAVSLTPARGAAPSGAERLCAGGSDHVLKKGRWTLIAKPEGLSRIIAHAEGMGGKLILATDGAKVARSLDAGCTWETVYEVATPTGEGTPVDGLLPRVSRLAVLPQSQTALLSIEGVGRAVAPQVLRSEGLGGEGTWEPVDGLPPATGVRELIPAPDSANVVYLITGTADVAGQNEPTGSNGLIYRSEDLGQTWTLVGTNGEVEKLAIEPDTDGLYLWIVRSNGTVAKSQNAGTTVEAVTMPDPPPVEVDPENPEDAAVNPPSHWRDVAVYKFVHISHAVVLTASPSKEADVTRAVVSTSHGAEWEELPVDQLGAGGGLVFGNSQSQLYSSGGSEATSWRGPGLVEFDVADARWKSVDDLEQISLLDSRRVQTPIPVGNAEEEYTQDFTSIWMRAHGGSRTDPDLIARFDPPPPIEGDPTLRGRPDCGGPVKPAAPRKAVRFDPERLAVQLQPGLPARVPVKAALAGIPVPVDVAFLLDSSTSMDPAIEGVFCSVQRLVRELPERHLDPYFALTAYNDFQKISYQRRVNLLPPAEAGPAIAESLRLLFTWRGCDEPLRSALYQLATGAGLDGAVQPPPNCSGETRHVDTGQQIDWRPEGKSLRTVFVVTDEPYEQTTELEPAIEQVYSALQSKAIHVIGLPVRSDAPPTDTEHSVVRTALLRTQLNAIAQNSKALAPRGGIDCDGGGTPDLAEGQPIVCPIDERGIKHEIDDTLVAVLTSLAGEDRQLVRIVPHETSGLSAAVEGEDVELDVRRDNDIERTAVLSCTEDQTGKKFDISFDVVVADKVLDTIPGVARCGTLAAAVVPPVPLKSPKKAAPPNQPAPAKQPAPAAVKPAPPNPAPAPAPAPAPQPAVAVAPPPPPPAPAPAQGAPAQAPAQAAAAQPGVAAQQQRQIQVTAAMISSDGGSTAPVAREHAMVHSRPASFTRRTAIPTEALVTLGVGLAGLLVFVGVSAAPRRRRREDPTPARVSVRADERRRGF